MNQPPPTEKQTGKRIVSKGEYAQRLSKRLGLFALAVFILGGGVLADAVVHFRFGSSIFRLFGPMLVAFGVAISKKFYTTAQQIDPGIPLTQANTADLPAPDSLVRASAEPVQEPQSVLLRAATEGVERHEEELVRASGVNN